MADEPTLANAPEARTPTGDLKDQSPPSSTPTPTPTPEPTDAAKSPEPTKSAAPDKYDFKAPEGQKLDAGAIEEATPVFKELGLDNAQAQRLVDLFNKRVGDKVAEASNIIKAQGEAWAAQVKADPDIGPKLDQIKVDLGRALDGLNLDPKVRQGFSDGMNISMIGSNPDFIKVFWAMAKAVNEGTAVNPGGPSKHGQVKPGDSTKPTLAQAMYPALVANRPN